MDSIAQAVGETHNRNEFNERCRQRRNYCAESESDNILHALIKVASHKEENGYCFNPETTIGIIFGEIKPPFESERVQAVCTLFENAQIHFRVTDYIKEEMWSKFRLNVCNNLPQAILGAGVGCYSDSTHMKAISEGLKKRA